MMNRLMIFLVLISITGEVIAQQSKLACQDFKNVDTLDVPLEELMETPVFIGASQQAACSKEAANIVSSISGEEILTRGARDLADVLQLIPGFTLGTTFQNMVDVGSRGITGDDGKMSVLVDGIMLTERGFDSNIVKGNFPIEQIDRIEIIRGSSSIVNGNFAETGLINIITKNAKKANGLTVAGNYGRMQRGEARKNINVTAGKVFDELEVSFSGKANESQSSDRIYNDAHGNSFDMANNSQLASLYGNLGLKYKDFNIRLLSDEYSIENRDGLADWIQEENTFTTNKFSTKAAKLDFEHAFSPNFKLNSNFDFSRQSPWKLSTHYDDGKPTELNTKMLVDYYNFNGKATWIADSGSYLAAGNSYQMTASSYSVPTNEIPMLMTDYSIYAEGVYKTNWADLLVGGRFDVYNKFGTNFAPRTALTKQFDNFHYKLLYTKAFHVPTGGEYELNYGYNMSNPLARHVDNFVPESGNTYEMELGYAFSSHFEVVANVFYTKIHNLFTFMVDEDELEYYKNSKVMATSGIETTLKYKNSMFGQFDLNYSMYQSVKNSEPSAYQAINVDGNLLHSSINVGFPTHKATLNHTFKFTPNFSFNHSLIFMSDRYGYSGTELQHYKPEWIYNTYFRYQNMPIQGAEIGLGLYDVFNARYQYVQEYNARHPPLPAESRELMLRLSYKF